MMDKMKKPKVFITHMAKKKMDAYIGNCDSEISGLGTVRQTDDGNFVIGDIFIFKQEVTGASTDLSPADISTFLFDMVKQKVDTSLVRVWWHSHYNFGVYWSGTDNRTCEIFDNDYMVSIVGNQAGDHKVRLDIYKPVRLTIDNISMEVLPQEVDDSFTAAIKKEIAEKVSKPTPTVSYHNNSYTMVRNECVDGDDCPYTKDKCVSPGFYYCNRCSNFEDMEEEKEEESSIATNSRCDDINCNSTDCTNCGHFKELMDDTHPDDMVVTPPVSKCDGCVPSAACSSCANREHQMELIKQPVVIPKTMKKICKTCRKKAKKGTPVKNTYGVVTHTVFTEPDCEHCSQRLYYVALGSSRKNGRNGRARA